MSVAQEFKNNSDYNVVISLDGYTHSIPAGEVIYIDCVIDGIDASCSKAKLLETGYPRVVMTDTLVTKRIRKYQIHNETTITNYKLINCGNYSVQITNNYIGKNYNDIDTKVILQKNAVQDVIVYGTHGNFIATYKNDNPESDVEKELQGQSATIKVIDTSVFVE